MPIDPERLAAELEKDEYADLTDQPSADRLNEIAGRRPYAFMTRAEFTAAYAPVLAGVWALPPEPHTKWMWYRDMLSQMETVDCGNPVTRGIVAQMASDGLATDEMAAGLMGPGAKAADLLAYLGTRPASRAEIAGIVGPGETVSHLDVAEARNKSGRGQPE